MNTICPPNPFKCSTALCVRKCFPGPTLACWPMLPPPQASIRRGSDCTSTLCPATASLNLLQRFSPSVHNLKNNFPPSQRRSHAISLRHCTNLYDPVRTSRTRRGSCTTTRRLFLIIPQFLFLTSNNGLRCSGMVASACCCGCCCCCCC